MPKLSKAAFGLAVSVCVALTTFVPAHAQPDSYRLRQASPTGSYIAGMAALDRLDAKSAARLLMQAAEAEWDNPHYAGRAFLAYLLLGRVADAAAIAQHLVDIDPQNELARLTLGTVALKQRRYNSATQELGRIPNETLIGITSGILDGWAHIGNNDVAGAYGIMGQLGELGFDEFLIFHRAVMSDVAGDRDAALSLARAATKPTPSFRASPKPMSASWPMQAGSMRRRRFWIPTMRKGPPIPSSTFWPNR